MNLSLAFKRLFDILVCLIALPFLLPLFFVVGIIIKLNSPGPVFYRGLRTGLGGKPFRIFKFRTMIDNADKIGGGTTALKDPRITSIGIFLRRYKLDELPQAFNVIKGDMSIVGPRPELEQYTRLYKGEELIILDVRPGITDYSSIKFNALDEIVGDEDADRIFEETVLASKNELRIKYVKEHTFWGDIALILQTIFLVFKKVL